MMERAHGWGLRGLGMLALAGAVLGTGCSSDPGLIDCAAYVDRQIECELIPPQNAEAVRDINVRICNRWEETYKQDVMVALDECTDVACDGMQVCIQEANQLCQADVSDSIERLCEKVVECGWEELTTMEACREALAANQGLYMCLKPSVLEDYVACVRGISCGPESEDAWYACGAEHVQ